MRDIFLVLGTYKENKRAKHHTIIGQGQNVMYDPTNYIIAIHRDNIKYILHLKNYSRITIIDLQKDEICGIWASDFGYICGETQLTYGNILES